MELKFKTPILPINTSTAAPGKSMFPAAEDHDHGAQPAIGGTITGGTVGSVLFIGTGPVIAQDNTKLFWDDINFILKPTNISLPATTSTTGIIYSASNTLLHTYPTGGNNIFIGEGCGNLTGTAGSMVENVGVGYQALMNLTVGNSHVALGRFALRGATTATSCVAIGDKALQSLQIGTGNIAIGESCILSATALSNVIGIGVASLSVITSGAVRTISIGNTALANLTSGPNCTAVGFAALNAMIDQGYGTAVGESALLRATGIENTAFGRMAGQTLTTGARCTFLGANADVSSATISDAAAIGESAVVGQSLYMMLGRSTICVGIAGAARPTTGSGGLIFPAGTALATMANGTAGLYAQTTAGVTHLIAIASDGTTVQLV